MKKLLLWLTVASMLFTSLTLTATAEESNWFTNKTPVTDYAFSFVLVGDTQYVTLQEPEKLPIIYDWILEQRETKKISYVFGLGDITHTSTPAEWETAKASIERMNGIVPYSVIRGNHDESKPFNQAFATDFYLAEQDGFYKDGEIDNVYRLFSVCGNDFLLLTLDFGPTNMVLKWANEVIEAHPNHRVIISTHGYLDKDGKPLDAADKAAPAGGDTSGIINNGDHMWDKLISKHENIFLVLSGHIDTDNVIVTQTKGEHGNVVTQMLVDTQFVDREEAVGNVVMLYFSNDGETVSIEQYSTIRKQYYMRESQREITVPRFSTEPPTVTETTAEETKTEDRPLESTDANTTPGGVEQRGCHAMLTPSSWLAATIVPTGLICIVRKRHKRQSTL